MILASNAFIPAAATLGRHRPFADGGAPISRTALGFMLLAPASFRIAVVQVSHKMQNIFGRVDAYHRNFLGLRLTFAALVSAAAVFPLLSMAPQYTALFASLYFLCATSGGELAAAIVVWVAFRKQAPNSAFKAMLSAASWCSWSITVFLNIVLIFVVLVVR